MRTTMPPERPTERDQNATAWSNYLTRIVPTRIGWRIELWERPSGSTSYLLRATGWRPTALGAIRASSGWPEGVQLVANGRRR